MTSFAKLFDLDLRRFGAGTEDGYAAMSQLVGEADDERSLRADDDEVDAELRGEGHEGGRVVCSHRMAARELGNPRVSGRRMELAEPCAACERPSERMLATARPHDQHLHAPILRVWRDEPGT
jgi:hypothetical protein